jgi:crotonobetainyl-CoA:carnitine CoA-transferase CaiB-like acyl-CoA transferase
MTEFPGRRLRVLELSQGVAGAVCGRILSGLGHDVVKCEPATGDYLRRLDAPAGSEETGALFLELNAGKRGLVCDAALGEDAIYRLLSKADLVIVDGNPASERLSAQRLHERFPELIVVSMSTTGVDGAPDIGEGDSLLAEALGGMAFMIGEPARSPLTLGGEQAAYSAGTVAVFGAMLALRRRDAIGSGDLVDVALADVVAYMDWKSDVRYAASGVLPRRTGAAVGRWRMIPACDGWVGVIFEGRQWPAMVELIGDERLRDERLVDEEYRRLHPQEWWPIIDEWAVQLPKLEIYRRAQAKAMPFGHVVLLTEVDQIEQFADRGFLSPADFEPGAKPGTILHSPLGPGVRWTSGPAPELGQHQGELTQLWSEPAATTSVARTGDQTAPLAGVTVVDLGTITAGAAAGRMFADYGATVIKVESPTRPDSFRRWIVDTEAASEGNRGPIAPLFDSNNAGKLAIAVDLKTEEGLAELKRVVAGADVFIENFGTGVTERLGISYGDLHELNPRLIYLSLSSQGQQGPEASSRSYGSTLDLLSGLSSITGYDADSPMWSSVAVNYPDQLASVFGATMATACLAGGQLGVHLDLAQREIVSWTISADIRRARDRGGFDGPTGNRRAGRSPHDVYPCAGEDEWVAITARTDEHRLALAKVIGGGPQPLELRTWLAEADAVDDLIRAWTSTRTAADCVRELILAGVPSVPVTNAYSRCLDPRFTARRVYLDAGTDGNERRLKGFPAMLHEFEPPVPPIAPLLGEHTEQILSAAADPALPLRAPTFAHTEKGST